MAALIVTLFLLQALFFSRTLVPSENENSYLGLGRLAVTGSISLYQDEITGQRLPLPFYVLGASQVLFGRNLWVGRLVAITFGLVVLLLTMYLAHRLGGTLAAGLAGVLLASQGAIVGHYSIAGYHAWSALLLMVAVVVLVASGDRRASLGMAAASLTLVSRTNMVGAIPYLWSWAMRVATTTIERIIATLVLIAPLGLFFLWDARHVKLLAHIPFVSRFVEPLGYRSILSFDTIDPVPWTGQLWSIVRFVRRYESWALAAAVILTVMILSRRHGGRPGPSRSQTELAIGGLAVWMLLWHALMFRQNLKWTISYFPDFAPLFAIVLGLSAARLLEQATLHRRARALLIGGLAVASIVSVVFIRVPTMPRPIPVPFVDDSMNRIDRAAAKLAAVVPPGERVFLVGQSIGVYLAGRDAYLQQMMAPGTLTDFEGHPDVTRKSGVWGPAEIDRWLGDEARYAVVTPTMLEGFRPTRPRAIGRIQTLLRDRFELVTVIDDEPTCVYHVYRRAGVKGRA